MYNQLYERRRRSKSKTKMHSSKWKEKPIKKEEYIEIDYTLDGSVKQLFLNLTKMQIPFDYENKLEPYFPDGMQKDEHGNYFIKIGESKTMFCGHLDTYCREYKRVWHIIKDNIIKTDGTTTLGGDDKAGIVIMIKMIEAGVPGLYYFFRGEEGVTSPTGTWGSKQALKTRGKFFEDYDRCIAFDRRGNSSIISSQFYQECCSPEFVSALEKEFEKNGLNYKDDDTGMWCDSGVFMETISECTNISVGYKSEHTFNEEQDMNHLEKLVDACIKIEWEKLPVVRDFSDLSAGIGKYKYDYNWQKYAKKTGKTYSYPSKSTKRDYVTMDDMFYHVVDLLEGLGYVCLNVEDFEEVNEMYFQNYDTSDFFGLRIIDYEIYISDDDTLKNYINLGDLENFTKYVSTGIPEYDDTYSDLDKSLDRILTKDDKKTQKSEFDNKFSELQDDTFTDFTKKRPDLAKEVVEFLTKSQIVELSSTMWLRLDSAMVELGYQMDYYDHGTGITPDDYLLWVLENWIEVNNIISNKYNKKQDNKIDITINKLKESNKFLSTINNIDLEQFHFDEYVIFSNLVTKQPELVKLVLKDIEINGINGVRDNTIKRVWEEIQSIDYKRSDKILLTAYPQFFIEWVEYYMKEIKKFYDMK